jgi:predicted DNA-binding transcriptional regulator YafY
MNRSDRLTAILMLLQRQPRTAAQLAAHFECSRRTILRDIQALCEIGVPIIAREGVGGGYALPEGYWLSPPALSNQEAFLLLLAMSTLSQPTETPFQQQRASLTAKLRTLLPVEQLAQVEHLLDHIQLNSTPKRDQKATYLEALLTASHEQRWVRVEYQSVKRRSVQHLLPRNLYSENGLWYCRAYSHERGEERSYRVDRILALDEPEQALPPPTEAPSVPYHHESHPQIDVRLTPRGAAYVESDRHLGPLLKREPDGSARLTLRCPPGELDWYARFFASLSEEAYVEGPPELRQRICQLGQRLLETYRE